MTDALRLTLQDCGQMGMEPKTEDHPVIAEAISAIREEALAAGQQRIFGTIIIEIGYQDGIPETLYSTRRRSRRHAKRGR